MKNPTPLMLLAAALAACEAAPPPEKAAAPRKMSAPVRWVRARAPRAGALLEAPARVVAEAAAGAEITILHRARATRFHVAEGDRVRAGDPIVDVQIPEVIEGAAQLGALSEQLAATRDRLEALRALEREGLAKAEQLFSLRQQVGALAQAHAIARALLGTYQLTPRDAARVRRDGGLTLRAPVDGIVTHRGARIGAVITPGDPPLAVIEGQRSARIQASLAGPLSQGEVDFVGQDGRVVALRAAPVSTWADGPTGRTTVWLQPAEPTPLPDGLAGRVRVSPPAGAVEVPSLALVRDPEQVAVIVLEGERASRIPVEVLLDSGTSAIVRGAIEVGQSVAEDGQRASR